MASTQVLFVIICSNGKLTGGDVAYDATLSPTDWLPNTAQNLLRIRSYILGLMKQDDERRHGVPLYAYPGNENLRHGRDLGGVDQTALYLPAARRYAGSFHRAMGPNSADLLLHSRHHVLILSGLYGLLRPTEQIQNYSCHVDDHSAIKPAWTAIGQLTSCLQAYIKDNEINLVFDMTALAGYRRLINWNSLAAHMPNIWHAFGRQTVGDGLLTPLGEILGAWLRGGDDRQINRIATAELESVRTSTDSIVFTRQDEPPSNFPRVEPQINAVATAKDEIVRLARCLKYLLASLDSRLDMEDAHASIDRLKPAKQIDGEVASSMHAIIELRNRVEHQVNPRITESDVADQRTRFRKVWKWAKQNNALHPLRRECREP